MNSEYVTSGEHVIVNFAYTHFECEVMENPMLHIKIQRQNKL